MHPLIRCLAPILVALMAGLTVVLPALSVPVAEIPFTLRENHVFIDVQIDGETLAFVFDTGAFGTALGERTADRLGLEASGSVPAVGAGGTTTAKVISDLELKVGEVKLGKAPVAVLPLGHLEEVLGQSLDGIIGRQIMTGRVVVIDHDRQMLELHEREGFRFEDRGARCDIGSDYGLLQIGAEVVLLNGDVVDGEFFFDSGAGMYVSFNEPFARGLGLSDRVGNTYHQSGRALTGKTLGSVVGRVAGLRLCGHEFVPGEDGDTGGIPVRLSLSSEGVQGLEGPAGLIGNEVIKRFNVTLDFDKHRVHLSPNARWGSPVRSDASGLRLIRTPHGTVSVFEVIAGSPAEESKIEEGQILVSIEGVPIENLTLPEIRERLKAEGETVVLKFDHDVHGRKEVAMNLRSLLLDAPVH